MAEADWASHVVWIPKSVSYNQPESPNVIKAWRAAAEQIPECPLKQSAVLSLRMFVVGMGEAFLQAFDEAFRQAFTQGFGKGSVESGAVAVAVPPPYSPPTKASSKASHAGPVTLSAEMFNPCDDGQAGFCVKTEYLATLPADLRRQCQEHQEYQA